MLDRYRPYSEQTEPFVLDIKLFARKLYLSRKHMCAESVMVALNHKLHGGLSEKQAFALASPFSMAMGKSGCMCGALSGAVMACGLFLGDGSPYGNRRKMRRYARQLHDAFKAANGSTCCKVLSAKHKKDRKGHFNACARVTADTAEMAARLILTVKPEQALPRDRMFYHRLKTSD